MIDRLPCPYGLVRYGVAPDHGKIKSITLALRKVLETEGIRFLGNVDIGADLSMEELHQHYDAIVFAYGAAIDRRLGIAGEELAGSFSATDFVAWYSGHPDTQIDRFTLDARDVVVVGVGNVAVDVARILAKTADDLRPTDLPDHVLDVLNASHVTDIHVLGRRGPAQAKFTTKELRELGELINADVIVREDELLLDEASEQTIASDAGQRRNLDILRTWAAEHGPDVPSTKPRRIHLRFLVRPVALEGAQQVEGVKIERTQLDGSGGVRGTDDFETLPAQMVLRSVGYRGEGMAGLPFDERSGTIPNEAGRVMDDGEHLSGVYVAGWIKRGPTGVIGTNKSDASETIASLIADAPSLPKAPERDPQTLLKLLADRGVDVVDWEGWVGIDEAEIALGVAQGRERVKIAQREILLGHGVRK
ncbi:MAG: NADPH-dependent glutamate synthase beta chain-like oxidoreductase [Mycobacterium sp.]|nr:NADPH-dependent glutamate synthase beta chain-like oxidoreductase [Mycobacterium sp.]